MSFTLAVIWLTVLAMGLSVGVATAMSVLRGGLLLLALLNNLYKNLIHNLPTSFGVQN